METKFISFTLDNTKNIVDNKIRTIQNSLSYICGSISVFMILEYWHIEYDICEFTKLSKDGIKSNDQTGSNPITLTYAILEKFRNHLTVDVFWEDLVELNDDEIALKNKIIEYGGTFNKSLDIEDIIDNLNNDNIPIIAYNDHFSPLKGYQKQNNKLYFPNFQEVIGDSDVDLETFKKNWDKYRICIYLRKK